MRPATYSMPTASAVSVPYQTTRVRVSAAASTTPLAPNAPRRAPNCPSATRASSRTSNQDLCTCGRGISTRRRAASSAATRLARGGTSMWATPLVIYAHETGWPPLPPPFLMLITEGTDSARPFSDLPGLAAWRISAKRERPPPPNTPTRRRSCRPSPCCAPSTVRSGRGAARPGHPRRAKRTHG